MASGRQYATVRHISIVSHLLERRLSSPDSPPTAAASSEVPKGTFVAVFDLLLRIDKGDASSFLYGVVTLNEYYTDMISPCPNSILHCWFVTHM